MHLHDQGSSLELAQEILVRQRLAQRPAFAEGRYAPRMAVDPDLLLRQAAQQRGCPVISLP